MERSKLVRWCEGVIEFGWLAVLVLAPLFMNRFSNWNIEPDRASLIRIIAILMLGAYTVKLVDGGTPWISTGRKREGGSVWKQALHLPFLFPILLVVASFALSTVFSIMPEFSIWGGAGRSQGLITLGAYLAIGFLLAAHLRSRDQLRRVQHAIIFVTVPLALHGFLQLMEWEPIPITGGVSRFRVEATAGNPDFLAAYFLMAFFFTVERFIAAVRDRMTVETNSIGRLRVALYAAALLMQFATIILTQARGPWIGFCAGVFLLVLLLLFVLRVPNYKLWATIWSSAGVLLVGFMLLGNILPQFDGLRDEPYVGRLFRLLEQDRGAGLARMVVWEGTVDLMSSEHPLQSAEAGEDPFHAARFVLGYGPEAFGQAVSQFLPPEYNRVMRSGEVTDRAHNETWNTLATTGLLGMIAYYVVYFAVFKWALHWLGFVTRRRDTCILAGLWLACATLMALVFYMYDDGWRFLGLALPLGVMIATAFYVYLKGMRLEGDGPEWRAGLIVTAILTVLSAHLVEAQFGITTIATNVYFWVSIALLYVVGRHGADSTFEIDDAGMRRSGKPSGSSIRDFLPTTTPIDTLVMLTLPFIFVSNLGRTGGPVKVLVNSLFTHMVDSTPEFGVGMLLLMVITIAFGFLHGSVVEEKGITIKGLLIYSGVVLGVWVIYGLVHSARLVPGAEGTVLDEQLAHIQGHFVVYLYFMIALLAGGGWYLRRNTVSQRTPLVHRSMASLATVAIVLTIAVPLVHAVAVRPITADVIFDLANKCTARRDWPCAIELSRRAILSDRSEEQYVMNMASALTEQAKATEGAGGSRIDDVDDVLGMDPAAIRAASQPELLLAADVMLHYAQRLNPYQPEHSANLGRLYRYWSTTPGGLANQSQLRNAAARQYDTALVLRPSSAAYLQEYGRTLASTGQHEEAIEVLRRSLENEPMADTYVLLARELDLAGRPEEVQNVVAVALRTMPDNELLQQRLARFR